MCFDEAGTAYAAATLLRGRRTIATASARAATDAPYSPGLLALREGPVLEAAVRQLPGDPDVLVVNATGLDHPRRAGLAVHLGAVLGLPTVGVTHRPLLAVGEWPVLERGATSPVRLGGTEVARWLCTRPGVRPVVAHAGWRTSPEQAADVVLAMSWRARTPEPIRRARELARRVRTAATHRRGVGGADRR